MALRSRTFNRRGEISGLLKVGLNTYTVVGRPGCWGSCDDEVGCFEKDNLLDVRKHTKYHSVMDGKRPTGTVKPEFQNYVPDFPRLVTIPTPSTPFAKPSNEAISEAVSRMNPSRPGVLLPAFLGELRDFPQMLCQIPLLIRGWGRHLIKPRRHSRRIQNVGNLHKALQDGGSSYLGWRFGWAPFIGDLSVLLNIQEDIVRRLQWMLKLQSGGSIKRRVMLAPERKIEEDGEILIHSNQALVYANHLRVFRSRSWITSRWVPLFPNMYRGAILGDLFERARQQALGLTTWGALQSWWELLPWSWLTDWFVNVGKKLALMNNSMMLRLASICWCRTSEVDGYYHVTRKPTWVTIKGTDSYYSCRKEREPLSAIDLMKDPPPSLPALTGRQMGILAALFAARV